MLKQFTAKQPSRMAGWLLIFTFALFFPLVVFGQSALTGVVTRDANLRAGPGTNYAIAGKATAGQTVQIINKNQSGDWYQLENKAWIAAFLVKVSPTPATPTPTLSTKRGITTTTSITTTLVSTETPASVITATATISTDVTATETEALTVTPAATPAAPLVRQLVKVTSVNSGDVIHVLLNGKIYRVRYLLIKAPTNKEPLFTEATALNTQLVKDKFVYLAKDISDTDKDGNLLRYIYLQNGTFVNAELVRNGYALLTTFTDDMAREPELLAAQQEAIKAERGLWAAQQPKTTPAVVASSATANRAANVRACPGTNCAITGHVTANQSLALIARNADKTWYQLQNGGWIAAFLVNNAPTALPVATPTQKP